MFTKVFEKKWIHPNVNKFENVKMKVEKLEMIDLRWIETWLRN